MANQGLIIGLIVVFITLGITAYLAYEGNIPFIPRHLFTKASGCKDPNYQEYNEDYEESDNETFCKKLYRHPRRCGWRVHTKMPRWVNKRRYNLRM